MSSSKKSPASTQPAQKSSRSFVACISCRRLKAKCVQSENPPTSACTRCRMRNIVCEYPMDNFYPYDYGHPVPHPMYSAPVSQGPPAGQEGSTLPYTRPPPPYTRPRYSDGIPYPNLSLGGQNYPSSAAPPAPGQGPPPSQYNSGYQSQGYQGGGYYPQAGSSSQYGGAGYQGPGPDPSYDYENRPDSS
ncbi:hypothetical protein C8F01DRAFT_1245699 [Mycena amicta]|nr:hypothetical protein C8F01DRAFT_1245699 [Mycena amicta]